MKTENDLKQMCYFLDFIGAGTYQTIASSKEEYDEIVKDVKSKGDVDEKRFKLPEDWIFISPCQIGVIEVHKYIFIFIDISKV